MQHAKESPKMQRGISAIVGSRRIVVSRGVTSARESRQGRQRGLQGPTVSDNIIEALYSSWMRLEEFREPSHGAIPGPSRSRSAGATFGSAGYSTPEMVRIGGSSPECPYLLVHTGTCLPSHQIINLSGKRRNIRVYLLSGSYQGKGTYQVSYQPRPPNIPPINLMGQGGLFTVLPCKARSVTRAGGGCRGRFRSSWS